MEEQEFKKIPFGTKMVNSFGLTYYKMQFSLQHNIGNRCIFLVENGTFHNFSVVDDLRVADQAEAIIDSTQKLNTTNEGRNMDKGLSREEFSNLPVGTMLVDKYGQTYSRMSPHKNLNIGDHAYCLENGKVWHFTNLYGLRVKGVKNSELITAKEANALASETTEIENVSNTIRQAAENGKWNIEGWYSNRVIDVLKAAGYTIENLDEMKTRIRWDE